MLLTIQVICTFTKDKQDVHYKCIALTVSATYDSQYVNHSEFKYRMRKTRAKLCMRGILHVCYIAWAHVAYVTYCIRDILHAAHATCHTCNMPHIQYAMHVICHTIIHSIWSRFQVFLLVYSTNANYKVLKILCISSLML